MKCARYMPLTGEDIPQGVGIEDSTRTNDSSHAEESLLVPGSYRASCVKVSRLNGNVPYHDVNRYR